MSAAKHRFLAVVTSLFVAGLMCATFAAGHPLDATDLDHDGFKNWADNCPDNFNPQQVDTDGDTADPVVDQPAPHPSTGPLLVYPYTPAAGQQAPVPLPTDRAADTGGDACDIDDDGDGVTDNPKRDNCKLIANPDQADADFDGKGDACDPDDDNDNVPDTADNCPLASNSGQADTDGDGIGDACDPDGRKGSGSGLQGGDPNDKKAPRVAIRTRSVHRYEELGRGLAVGVRCSEGCSLDARLVVRGRAVARGAAQVESRGSTFVFLTFARGTLRRLARSGRAPATFRLVAEDANGNRAGAQKRVTLRP